MFLPSYYEDFFFFDVGLHPLLALKLLVGAMLFHVEHSVSCAFTPFLPSHPKHSQGELAGTEFSL